VCAAQCAAHGTPAPTGGTADKPSRGGLAGAEKTGVPLSGVAPFAAVCYAVA
jgi:hypothetical protein